MKKLLQKLRIMVPALLLFAASWMSFGKLLGYNNLSWAVASSPIWLPPVAICLSFLGAITAYVHGKSVEYFFNLFKKDPPHEQDED